uniref:Hypothetical chloroplast RF1 n=1 Tax=Characiochloris acuminata TaxID=167768 RepID=A0A0S2LQ15_9CHLO|nr:hypothetical chloroplast RF1 [Characiochloris acuminata]ALO63322.1 hypothetical chloroplast RF1 [Characiochloris acuminata]
MISFLSLVTSVKDYLSIVHKLIESDSAFTIQNYSEIGPIITYFIISVKDSLSNFLSGNWLQNIWSLPLIIPDISSAMISEISVLDGYFHNAFDFLDTPISYFPEGQNTFFYSIEKFTIGFINSFFLFLPTSTAHIITLRRFVMQGLEAGYLAGLGTVAGNILWLTSIIFGWRFFVIPWLSLDIFRYLLGFLLLIKYMWDSYNERRMVLEDLSKRKIFLFNFLLALTEQTTIYPFITNLSVGSETSILESFPADNSLQFFLIHSCYIGGLLLGSLSLLHLTCWFWENPAFQIYMWLISSLKVSTSFYYKIQHFLFLYLTMISAITSIPYYGLDYTLAAPLGLVNEDRLIQDKTIRELSFLGSKASDRNTRRNRGRHGRRERWKRRIRKYRTFDASLYDQGSAATADLFTIEDLNYGFDRFWLRRKLRNHRVRFRFFPGPWMRSFKKQLAKPRLESYTGPRVEFFRILFEQVYHPSFHAYETPITKNGRFENTGRVDTKKQGKRSEGEAAIILPKNDFSLYNKMNSQVSTSFGTSRDKNINSALRKFIRKMNIRLKTAQIKNEYEQTSLNASPLYSKRWKHLLSHLSKNKQSYTDTFRSLNFYKNKKFDTRNTHVLADARPGLIHSSLDGSNKDKNEMRILRYRSLLFSNTDFGKEKKSGQLTSFVLNRNSLNANSLYLPLKFYLKKEQGLRKKLRYYTPTVFRGFSIENNAPYFRVMMKRYFYYYKPTNRWEKTMKVASLRKARRKSSRIPRKLQFNADYTVQTSRLDVKGDSTIESVDKTNKFSNLILTNRKMNPTHDYSVIGKKASRYRYQIYKDVLQHWYYSPFNRFLLKLDVDSFIRRQPKTHFINRKEENLLHLRRFLLSEHYDTLRWYTNMQHYRSMKTEIGGTKSFASRTYNQQFFGTFKKIRHLFAITPSQIRNQPQSKELSILKFDQSLYNEFPNTSKQPLVDNYIIHEELLADDDIYKLRPNDLLDQSQQVVRTYLIKASPIRQEYIRKLLNEKNYIKLSQFLIKGQKVRGTKAVTNDSTLFSQEKDYLFTNKEKEQFYKWESSKLHQFLRENNLNNDFYFIFNKKWKRSLNDQEFLKNYLLGRIDKREKRRLLKEKNLRAKLERFQTWLNTTDSKAERSETNEVGSQSVTNKQGFSSTDSNLSTKQVLTTGLQKSIVSGITTLNNITEKQISDDLATQGSASAPSKIRSTAKWLLLRKVVTMNQLEIKTSSSRLTDFILRFDHSLRSFQQKEKIRTELQTSIASLSNIVLSKERKSNYNFKQQFAFFYKNYSALRQNLISFDHISKFIKPIKRKSLSNWRKKERILSKQKRLRKEFKKISTNKKKIVTNNETTNQRINLFSPKNIGSTSILSQSDINTNTIGTTNIVSMDMSRKKRSAEDNPSVSQNIALARVEPNAAKPTGFLDIFKTFGLKRRLRRKKTPQRRSRTRRGRGVVKKRTLSDLAKKDLMLLRNLSTRKDENKVTRLRIYQKISKYGSESIGSSNLFAQRAIKQRKSKLRRQRFWKQKRSKYSQKRRKYRKRRRYVIGKIRVLSKQFKRIQSKFEIQQWWWKQYLPNLQATTDALWQIEKDRQIQQKLNELSVSEIFARDKQYRSLLENKDQKLSSLQIGDLDFKPLFIPEAIRIREERISQLSKDTVNKRVNRESVSTERSELSEQKRDNLNIVNKLYENLFTNQSNFITSQNQSKFRSASSLRSPFYAGWDESQRKFIVTNRLLSRKEAGVSLPLSTQSKSLYDSIKGERSENNDLSEIHFTAAPLKGMNAATTLYWQIPFTTYDPDQFFALGMDGFSPVGWRRFQFRHSILKSWLYNWSVQSFDTSALSKNIQTSNFVIKTAADSIQDSERARESQQTFNLYSLIKNKTRNSHSLRVNLGDSKKLFNISRRIKKRYRRVKKHPRTPVWFPSGPLAYQVLPVHYIYVFYKRSRLPRDRYLKRRLLNVKKMNQTLLGQASASSGAERTLNYTQKQSITTRSARPDDNWSNNIDFTLQKRIKPKRKYHRKRKAINSVGQNIIIPRRLRFIANTTTIKPLDKEDERSENFVRPTRPLTQKRITQNKSIADLVKEQKTLLRKQRRSDLSRKQPTNLIRVKQLRRRVQRQIIRTVWRYKPRAGGFVWPGDYLRLELVKAPKLQKQKFSQQQNTNGFPPGRKVRKKKRTIQEWQLQPKKYLLHKHNKRVLRKKLQKAQRSHKIRQRIKELSFLTR